MEAQLLHDVNEVSAILIQTPGKPGDLKSVLQHIAQTAHDSFATDACVILAFNPITGGFIGSQVVGNLHAENELLHDRPRPKGVTQQVLNQKDGVVLIEDLELEPQYHNPFTRKEGFRAFAGLSLQTRHRKRPLGVIYLDFRQPKKFSPAERESYRIFAVQAAFLLQEAWLAHHYEEIARIGQDVNHNLATADELFQELQRYVNTVLDDTHTLILAIYQPQTNALEIRLRTQDCYILVNRAIEEGALEGGACEYIIETQESLYIRQLSEEKAQLPFQIINISGTEEMESLIFVPLTLRGVSLGVLSIQHHLPDAYGQEDLFVLQLLANYIALALHNMRLYGGLSQLNETGQLLTRLLESEQTLQATVDKICDATLADLVVLYPYEASRHCFVLPPSIAGTLLDSTSIQSMSSTRPDDIVERMLHHEKPIFAKNTTVDTGQDGTTHIRQGSFGKRENIRSTAALPLRVGDELVGVLFANFRQPQRFDATQKLFIEGLAHYAAIAIKNAQVFGKLSLRRIHELEILQKIDRELNRSLDLESVLYTLLRLAHEHVPAEEASILLHNPRAYVLETAAAIGRHAEISRKQMISLHESRGITRRVLEEKKPARVNNVHYELPWRDLHFPVAVDTISELDVPLLDGDEVIGVLNFESTREGAFSQEDQDFLITLAGQAVLAIKKAQAYEREKRLAEEGRVLNQISKEITSQLDPIHVFDLILEKALELTHSTLGSLHLFDLDVNTLLMVAERGVAADKKGQRQKLGQGIVGYVAKHRQLQNVGDVTQPPWNEIYMEFFPGARSELAVPMLAGGELRGVLNVESPSLKNFSESDERLLQGLADLAVVALQNAQAYEREKRLVAEAQVLNEISKEITSQLDPAHVLDLILAKALELTHSHMGNLMLYDRDLNDLRMATERGVAEDNKGKRQKLGQGIVGYVATKKQLLNVVDVTQQPWNEIFLEYIPGTRSELAVPLLAGDELRGVLNVESPSPNNFNESDERLLQGLADLAVVALQNAQAYEREKRLVAEAQVLNEISNEITSQLDLTRVFNLILEKALELTHSTTGNLMIYDPERNDLWMAAERGIAKDRKVLRQSLDQGVVGYVARNKELVNVDLSQPPWSEVNLDLIPGARSELAIPMLAGDELRGVLNVESPSPNNFSEGDERLLQGLADLAVIALQNARAYEREKRLAQESLVLNEISKEITSQLDYVRVFNLILGNALELTHSTLGSLHLYDPHLDELRMVAERGVAEDKKGQRQKPGQGIVGYVAQHKQLQNIGDVNQHPWNEIYIEFVPGARSELAVPMLAGDELRGVLNIESPIPNKFTKHDQRLLRELADLAVIALQNVERYKEAEREAQRFKLLSQAGQELSKITDLEQLERAYEIVVQIADEQSQSQAVIYSLDETNTELVLKYKSSDRDAPLFERIKLDEGISGQVARERRTIVVRDADNLPPGIGPVKQSDPRMRSLVVTPIMFKDQYYGSLGLRHEAVSHFRRADIQLYEGLAQLLASTIHRLETAKARQEFEQRALSAEEMSSIGQSAYEVTHRLGNDLGLVEFYVADIQSELERLGVTNGFVSKKLDSILQSVKAVLSFSGDLKQELARLGAEEAAGEPMMMSPRVLLEEAAVVLMLPSNIRIHLEIDDDVAAVHVIHSLIADILRNLVTNAIQAMPEGGEITLHAHNAGRSVALEVSDTGVGISQEKLPKVFELFFSTKGSSGFGLWSARRMALKNHGDLKVESEPGQGTTFTLLLPRAD